MENNLLTRVLAAIVAVAAIAISLVVGLFAALTALGLVVIGWVALTLRMWQLRRRSRKTGAPDASVIEGEYRVVHRPKAGEDD